MFVLSLADLKIQLYADGADFAQMVGLNQHRYIRGFTTNPSLCLRAGVTYYEKFIRDTLEMIPDKPVSFEVLSDDREEMLRQGRKLAGFGPNVYVKIPITNSKGETMSGVIEALSADGIHVNATAIMTHAQAAEAAEQFYDQAPGIVSVFAGRIADTGVHAEHHVAGMVRIVRASGPRSLQTLWASTREVGSIFAAERAKCDLITVTMDHIAKLDLIGKDLTEYSRETVQQFYQDGQKAGLLL